MKFHDKVKAVNIAISDRKADDVIARPQRVDASSSSHAANSAYCCSAPSLVALDPDQAGRLTTKQHQHQQEADRSRMLRARTPARRSSR